MNTKLVVALLVLAGAILAHGILSNGLIDTRIDTHGALYKINRLTGATQLCNDNECWILNNTR
jgi:hypothetical protein